MKSFLQEFEAEFGVLSHQWSLEQWKKAAIGGCKAADLLEAEAKEQKIIIQKTLSQLDAEHAKSERLRHLLESAVTRILAKRGGRPRKPKYLASLLSVRKRPPGRPKKIIDPQTGFTREDDAAELYRWVEHIKSEHKISKDTDALRLLWKCVRLPLRQHEKHVAADAKLLSWYRKKFAK